MIPEPTLRMPVAAALLLGLAACCPGPAVDERGWPRELVLGLVPANEAEMMVENLDPITDFLSERIGIPVRGFVPQDYTGLVEAMGSGRADIGMLPPFAAMLAARRYDIEPLLISVRGESTGYRTQWMTGDASVCDAPPEPNEANMLECRGDIAAVRGRSVAFTDPNSTTGFLFPAQQLANLGINHERDIQAIFVGSHDAAVAAVRRGDVDFGVAYEDARRMIRPQHPDVAERVIVFNHSEYIPNDGVQVRGDLPQALKYAIARAFLEFAEEQAAHLPREQRALYIIYEIDGFVPAEEGVYDTVAKVYELMRR
jgi:phosphonate transport system substrate-binding protein